MIATQDSHTLLPLTIKFGSSCYPGCASFAFAEPTTRAGGPQDDPTHEHSSNSASKLKILMADDEPLIVFTMTEILQEEGFEVFSAADGIAAVEAARALRPDIVLTDVMMPKINGIEVAKSIKAFLPQCRIVLFSGQAATGQLLEQARAEGHDFEILTKPIEPEALLAALARGPSSKT